jgi:16S rRNA (cytosine967-C5)-methyltransferase
MQASAPATDHDRAPPLAELLRDAAQRVAQVAGGRSLLQLGPPGGASSARRAALLDLTHGTLRRFGRVQAIVRALSHRPRADPLLEALLWCSIYALESGRYRDHVVVDQAVRACALLERWPAKGYVNGLLRRLTRERDAVEAKLASDREARWQHPNWWIETLSFAYPASWQAVLEWGNAHPPMCLRVNSRRGTIEDYRARLAQAQIEAHDAPHGALRLPKPVPVARLPGFANGDVSVQDAGAQRAAGLLAPRAGDRVLDACAAPGGKSAHLLERSDIALTALDVSAERCVLLRDNLARLQLQARVITADCSRVADWWDGRLFERVLADVPCTASGVARRHPDLKWLRRASDVPSFAAAQGQMVDVLWRVLAPGGKLLYATCSVFPEENEGVVQGFLARQPDARRLELPDGGPAQLLPGSEHDGFFYALLEKQS